MKPCRSKLSDLSCQSDRSERNSNQAEGQILVPTILDTGKSCAPMSEPNGEQHLCKIWVWQMEERLLGNAEQKGGKRNVGG